MIYVGKIQDEEIIDKLEKENNYLEKVIDKEQQEEILNIKLTVTVLLL